MDQKTEDSLIDFTQEFWSNAYQTNIGKLIGICYRYTRNNQLSEDLAHDAFLKAIEKSHGFRGDGHFDAWLRRIVVNHVLQYLRNQKKTPYTEQLTPDHTAAVTMQDNASSIKSIEFTAVELLETIDQLPEHHRMVFNLYVLEKFSHARIGEELGISEGTSKSHLARARKKLQQLLSEKMAIQKEKGNEERAAILLFAIADDARMDQMFVESFDQFSIPPKHPLSLDSGQGTDNGPLKKLSSKKSLRIIVASSAVISISILFLVKSIFNDEVKTVNNTASAPVLANQDSMAYEKNIENVSPQTATISQDSVNSGRNLKLKSMKPLDSLALMLALSTNTVHASALKDSIINQIQKPSVAIAFPSIDSNLRPDQSKSAAIPVIDREERGSFRASSLIWDKDNMEVYFKGEVSVDFKDQHFRGNGSFDILGKVHLLIVDGQQVPLGKTIKLLNEDYHLVVLNSTEASSKYGDLGKYGAVLIYRSNQTGQ